MKWVWPLNGRKISMAIEYAIEAYFSDYFGETVRVYPIKRNGWCHIHDQYAFEFGLEREDRTVIAYIGSWSPMRDCLKYGFEYSDKEIIANT